MQSDIRPAMTTMALDMRQFFKKNIKLYEWWATAQWRNS
jgi:hypothetical protein